MPSLGATRHFEYSELEKKRSAIQKLATGNSTIKTCAKTFIVPNQTRDTVVENGTNAMKVLFEERICDSVAQLRYNTFVKKLSESLLSDYGLDGEQGRLEGHRPCVETGGQ